MEINKKNLENPDNSFNNIDNKSETSELNSNPTPDQENKFDATEVKEGEIQEEEAKDQVEKELTIEELEKEIEILKGDNEKLLNNQEELESFLKRQKAEFDNYRKRVQEEKVDLIRYGSEDFLRSFLTVLDGFEKALEVKSANAEINSFLEGFTLLKKQIDELLEKHGVVVSTKINDEFNPSYHQAIQFTEGSEEKEKVTEIFQKGYFFHEKVLREAMVKIAKKKSQEKQQIQKNNTQENIQEKQKKN